MSHHAPWKEKVVADLKELMMEHSTVAVVRVDKIPALQLQEIRAKLRGRVRFKVAKKTLLKLALEDAGKEREGINQLTDHMEGQTAILGTNLNPFTLYQILNENMRPMPAKGGEISPEDIVIEAGETSFPPGPIVGELGKVGIPAAIDKGKVVIRKRATPVKKGGKISRDLAQALTKLEIFPFKAGIKIDGVWEDGQIYRSEDLDIDMETYRENLRAASRMAFNLAVFTAYMTPQTAVPLLAKARSEALNLAVFARILTDDSRELILSKAYKSMLALARLMSADAADDELSALLEGAARAAPQAPLPEEEEKEGGGEETEEEEVSEEEAAAGLGALFG